MAIGFTGDSASLARDNILQLDQEKSVVNKMSILVTQPQGDHKILVISQVSTE